MIIQEYKKINTRSLFTNSGPSKGIGLQTMFYKKEEKFKPEMKKMVQSTYVIIIYKVMKYRKILMAFNVFFIFSLVKT